MRFGRAHRANSYGSAIPMAFRAVGPRAQPRGLGPEPDTRDICGILDSDRSALDPIRLRLTVVGRCLVPA